jgi:hypothetical protein
MNDPTYYTDIPNSVRCGRGNMDHALDTETLKVQAGDSFEFVLGMTGGYKVLDDKRFWDCQDGRGFCTHFGDQLPQDYVSTTLHVEKHDMADKKNVTSPCESYIRDLYPHIYRPCQRAVRSGNTTAVESGSRSTRQALRCTRI